VLDVFSAVWLLCGCCVLLLPCCATVAVLLLLLLLLLAGTPEAARSFLEDLAGGCRQAAQQELQGLSQLKQQHTGQPGGRSGDGLAAAAIQSNPNSHCGIPICASCTAVCV
jgi:hypothetical protein